MTKTESEALIAFGALVRLYRETAQLTQEDLADLANLSTGYLGSLERGKKNISLINIIGLAAALRIPASAMVSVVDVVADRNAAVDAPKPRRAR